MNSIHEPSSRTMSKNRLRNSIESNRAKNRLSAQPTGPAARPGRAPCCAPRAARRTLMPPAPARLPRPCVCCARPAVPAQRPTALCSMGSSPFQVLHIFFSLLFFFFISFSHWKITNKYIYLFSFIFQYTNKFIKIYFIYIFFFHFPTNQINWLNLFYLLSCSSLHIVNSKVCFPTCLCAIYLSTQTFTSNIQHVIHTKHIHTTIHQST